MREFNWILDTMPSIEGGHYGYIGMGHYFITPPHSLKINIRGTA